MRLGSIRYINSLPVDLGLIQQKVPFFHEVIRGTPAELNQNILDHLLDVSPVSSMFYAKHQADFQILPDLSISSESGVQSVLLFSRCQPEELAGKKIWLTGEGRTTPALLEILCRKLYGFAPQFITLEQPFEAVRNEGEAILLIGDDALTHRAKMEAMGYQATDLAEIWRRWTGCGFVFAVWVVRQDLAESLRGEVAALHQSILLSRQWGLTHPEEIISEARRQTKLPEMDLEHYFSCLSYELDENLCKGMRLYFQYAQELGLLKELKPLRFFDGNLDSWEDKSYNHNLQSGKK